MFEGLASIILCWINLYTRRQYQVFLDVAFFFSSASGSQCIVGWAERVAFVKHL